MQQLIENAKNTNKAVVEELVPNVVQIGDIQKVLQHLLRERVPIRDMVTILETMADFASRVKDMEQMGELVRSAIARTITRQYLDGENKLHCLTLAPDLERALSGLLQQTSSGMMLAMEQGMQSDVVNQLRSETEKAMAVGVQPVLLSSATVRLALKRTVERYLPQLPVLAYNEVASRADVEFIGQVRVAQAAAA